MLSPMLLGILYGILLAVYFALGICQLGAIVAGLQLWFEISWIVALLCSFYLTWVPVIGTVTGIIGAHAAWGWPWLAAIGMFAGPLCMLIVLAIMLSLINRSMGTSLGPTPPIVPAVTPLSPSASYSAH